MKPKPDFETPFEVSLAEFEMAPLPEEWKSELIDNALSEAADRKILQFPSFAKMAIGLMAACWVLIGFLHAATPANSTFAGPEVAAQKKLTPEDRMMLVAHFSGGSRFNSTRTP